MKKNNIKENKTKLTKETAKLYVSAYNTLVGLFGEKLTDRVIKKFYLEDFSQTEYLRKDQPSRIDYFMKKGYPVINDNTSHYFRETMVYKRDTWERSVYLPAVSMLLPKNYQSKEPEITRKCLETLYPELKNIEINIYSLSYSGYPEVYVKCDNGKSLYCPLEAFTKKDFEIIRKRHTDYNTEYYGNTKERKEKYLPDELATLETSTALKIKEILNAAKEKTNN